MKSYHYKNALVGFAERDLDTWDGVAGALSWTRTIGCLRRGFKKEVDLEPMKESYSDQVFGKKSAEGVGKMMVPVSRLRFIQSGTGSCELIELTAGFVFELRSDDDGRHWPAGSIHLLSRLFHSEESAFAERQIGQSDNWD